MNLTIHSTVLYCTSTRAVATTRYLCVRFIRPSGNPYTRTIPYTGLLILVPYEYSYSYDKAQRLLSNTQQIIILILVRRNRGDLPTTSTCATTRTYCPTTSPPSPPLPSPPLPSPPLRPSPPALPATCYLLPTTIHLLHTYTYSNRLEGSGNRFGGPRRTRFSNLIVILRH